MDYTQPQGPVAQQPPPMPAPPPAQWHPGPQYQQQQPPQQAYHGRPPVLPQLGFHPATQQQQQPPLPPQQSLPQPGEFSTLTLLYAIHSLLDGYEVSAPGAYPQDLRSRVLLEIDKLRTYQARFASISSEAKNLMNTVFSQMITPSR